MKRIVCELCGSSSFLKTNGMYVCQDCGCVFTLEEVRKMIRDDDAEPSVNPSRYEEDSTDAGERALQSQAIRDLGAGSWNEASVELSALAATDPQNPYSTVFPHLCTAASEGDLSELAGSGAALAEARGEVSRRWGLGDDAACFFSTYSHVLSRVFPIVGEATARSLDESRSLIGTISYFARPRAKAEYLRVATKMYGLVCKAAALQFNTISIVIRGLEDFDSSSIAGDLDSIIRYLSDYDSRVCVKERFDFSEMEHVVASLRK